MKVHSCSERIKPWIERNWKEYMLNAQINKGVFGTSVGEAVFCSPCLLRFNYICDILALHSK